MNTTNFPGSASGREPWEASGLLSAGRYKSFATGDVLLAQDAGAADVALIRRGIVKITLTAGSRNEAFLGIRRAGDLAGEDFVIRGSCLDSAGIPASRKVIALTPGNAIVYSTKQFLGFLDGHPDVMLMVARNLCDRLAEAEARIASVAQENADQRLARALCELYDLGRYGMRGEGHAMPRGSEIPVRISQVELAEWIGASRETVDRALRRFREREIISTSYRRIVILDFDTLARIGAADATLSANRRL